MRSPSCASNQERDAHQHAAQVQLADLAARKDSWLQQARALGRKCRSLRTALRSQRAQAAMRVGRVRVIRQRLALARHEARQVSRHERGAAVAAGLDEVRLARQLHQLQQVHQQQLQQYQQLQSQQRGVSWLSAATSAFKTSVRESFNTLGLIHAVFKACTVS